MYDVGVTRRAVAFREPLVTSYGELRERELFEFRLTTTDGLTGVGEAAPLEPYDGVAADDVERLLDAYAAVLREASSGMTGPQLIDACRAVGDVPCAIAAVDLALWDLAGKRAGRPVAALLREPYDATVAVNATVGATDRAGAAAEAAAAAREGFGCVKLKVGTGDDGGRVAAVRAAIGPDVLLRLDANGAWSPDEAVATISALAPAGLELVEEPVHGLDEMRAVRDRVATRVALDESAALPGAFAAGVADAICLKISRSGGIGRLVAQAALARAAGTEVYIASSFDGPIGIAAALHAAAALRVSTHCGLATLGRLELETPPELQVRVGTMAVPPVSGLLA
jgi:o-succinylbenzoate synthase